MHTLVAAIVVDFGSLFLFGWRERERERVLERERGERENINKKN
jgi:hypothetical protein